jgi:hypothetical protein
MKRNTNIGNGQNKQPYAASTLWPSMGERLAFSLRESAGILGISYSSAHRLCQRGKNCCASCASLLHKKVGLR